MVDAPSETLTGSGSAHTAGSSPPRPGSVRSAIGWSYVLTAGRAGSSIIVTFLLAKLLGPKEFGPVAMATVFILIGQMVIQQGLVSAIVQRDKLTDEHLNAAFGVLIIGGLGVGLLAAAASPVWALINREPRLTLVCVALSPLVLINALSIVPEAVLRRELRFRAVAIRTLIPALISGVVGVLLALAGAGIWSLVGQQVVNAALGLVILWAVCPWRPSRRPRLGAIRDLWAFSAHSTSAGIALMLSSRADIIFAGIFFGPVATGIYRLAARLPDMLVDVTVRSIQQVALPSLSRLQRDRVAFAAHLAQLQRLGALVGLPMLGILAATAPALVDLLGPQWAGTARPLQLLCLYGAVNVFGALLGPALQAIGQPGTLAAISWFRGVLGVATLVGVGTVMAGGEPAAQATVLALAGVGMQVTVTGLSLWMTVRRAAGATITRFLAPTLPAILSALAAALVPAGTDRLGVPRLNPVVELLIVGTGAALAAGVVLWFTDRPLRQLIRDRLRRLAPRPERADVGTA